MGEKTKRFLIDLGLGLLIAAALTLLRGALSASDAAERLRLECDGFFVAAVLLLAASGLTWTRNGGAFDGLGFTVSKLVRLKWPFAGDYREEFGNYCKERHDRDRSPLPPLFAGLSLGLVAVALFLLYQRTL